jgi:hypothetical protein
MISSSMVLVNGAELLSFIDFFHDHEDNNE